MKFLRLQTTESFNNEVWLELTYLVHGTVRWRVQYVLDNETWDHLDRPVAQPIVNLVNMPNQLAGV